MDKRVLIVSATPRKNGNSERLAEGFARGAREAGHNVTTVAVRQLDLRFCTGCLQCLERPGCVLNDDMNALYDSVRAADVLVFATPVYYYGMSGQLKTFLDRLNPLYGEKNRFTDVYVLATAAETDPSAVDGTVRGVQGWIDCFPRVRLAGVVRGTGVSAVGEIEHTEAVRLAYEMGKKS